jgi:hypothetical protein
LVSKSIKRLGHILGSDSFKAFQNFWKKLGVSFSSLPFFWLVKNFIINMYAPNSSLMFIQCKSFDSQPEEIESESFLDD